MSIDVQQVHDQSFCMVYMTVLDETKGEVELQPIHGVARMLADRLVVEIKDGTLIAVPDSALPSIRRSDGREPMLENAEYFVIVKVGSLPGMRGDADPAPA